MKSLIKMIKLGFALSIIVVAVGCSEFDAPIAPQSAEQTFVPSQYPPLEDAIANLELAGYRTVNPAPQARLDDHECDSVIVDRYARVGQGGNLNMSGLVRLEWESGVVPNNMTLQIVAPSECIGAADFYPHPTYFNGNVRIIWDMDALDLPDDFDYSTIVPLYIHDDGTPEEVSYSWRQNNRQLVVETNHFSRYIISQRISG